MDAELKTLLVALAEGQVKLAEGQAAFARDTKVAIGELAGHVSELADHVVRLDEGQVKLGERMGAMADTMVDLGKRMDGYAQAVIKGFTNGTATDRKLDDEIHALDARVTKLERKKPGPKKRR